MVPDKLSRAIELIYAAAEGDEPWTTPLSEFCDLVRARISTLLERRGGTGPDTVREAVGADPSHRESYERYYWSTNIYMQRLAPMLRPGLVAPHEMFVTNEEILRSEYYQDFLRHVGIFHVIAGVISRRGRSPLRITVCRARHDPPFSRQDERVVALLLPHFQRAIAIHERLQTVPTQTADAELELTPAEAAIADRLKAGRLQLTRAEVSVAERLAAGQSVAQICAALNIRETTVRTHLRHLFQKTQTRRQAELVAHLLRH